MELIRKTFAAPVQRAGENKLTYVLSDATLDRYGDIIEPAGWVLKWFKKNPVALFAHDSRFVVGRWENARVVAGQLLADLVLALRGTSARIDEIIGLVDQKMLPAVSVGFKPIKSEPIDPDEPYGGLRFVEQELLECSLVSVPANPAALQVAKSLNISSATMSLAFGEQADVRRRGGTATGERAASPQTPKGKPNMTTLAQRVQDAQTALVAARDAYQNHVAQDDFDIAQGDALRSELEAREARLQSLKDAEASLARSTSGGGGGSKPAAPAIRRPLGVRERDPKPGDMILRMAAISLISHVTQRDPIAILEERYRDHEATNVFVRAAVDPAKTSVQGWASELIETETVAFLETLRDISFYPRLAVMGANLQFGQGRGAIKIPSRSATPSISGSFVGEGSPIPVRRFGLTSTTLNPHKMGVISYFTKEMAKYSTPQIEGMLRAEMRGDTADTVDTLLTDNNAGSAIRPAGLLYNVSALTASTDGGWAAILADIETLAAPFDAAKAGRNLVLLMNKREARKLALGVGPDKVIGSMRKVLEDAGITPISSVNVPAGRLIMLDAADFATAAGDQPEFDASEQAVIHAEDTSPAQIGTAGSPNVVAAPVISMFQTASIALRMLLDITWAMRRAGMVQWIEGADWTYSPGSD